MKFRSRSKDEVTRLASTTGHVCLIGQEWAEVPEHMEGDAYSKGCISEEMFETIKDTLAKEAAEGGKGETADLDLDKETKEGARNATIKTAIDKMIDDPKPSDFTARGLPNLAVLSERCKFPVPKVVMEPIWEYIQAERDKEEE